MGMIAAHFPGKSGQDKTIRETIKRYCHASVATIFHRYGQKHFKWNDINLRGTLTSKEIAILKKQGSYPEAIWSWIGSYLADIYKAGLLPCVVYQNCLDQVSKGRGGAGLIGAQMGCQLPLTYVHAVNFMIKFNNVIMTVAQGYSLAMNIFHRNTLSTTKELTGNVTSDEATYTFDQVKIGGVPTPDEPVWGYKYLSWIISSLASVIIMTTLYNAMLVVAASLSNPFQQDRLSFPGLWYEKGVDEDARFFHNMALNKPWKHSQKFVSANVQSALHADDSSGGREGPSSLQSLIHRMSKHGSNSGKGYGSPPNRIRSPSPNNMRGKGQISPYDTLVREKVA